VNRNGADHFVAKDVLSITERRGANTLSPSSSEDDLLGLFYRTGKKIWCGSRKRKVDPKGGIYQEEEKPSHLLSTYKENVRTLYPTQEEGKGVQGAVSPPRKGNPLRTLFLQKEKRRGNGHTSLERDRPQRGGEGGGVERIGDAVEKGGGGKALT